MSKTCSIAALFAALLTFSVSIHAGDFSQAAFVPPVPAAAPQAAVELVKQPVFLFCPHKESAGSWSLYVIVDKKNPKQVLGLGLEELAGKNSKENTYNGVLEAQKSPATRRNEIARLDARDFGSSRLEVKENNMLSIGVTPAADGLHLEVNARISLDGHFIVGGSAKTQRDLILQYSYLNQGWVAKSPTLSDKDGRSVIGKFALCLTGIVFSASTTGVSRIVAVDDIGRAIILMDR